jgi:hypothetical protein
VREPSCTSTAGKATRSPSASRIARSGCELEGLSLALALHVAGVVLLAPVRDRHQREVPSVLSTSRVTSPVSPEPRWWHHTLWRLQDGCAHQDGKVTYSCSLVVVNWGYNIQAFKGRCRTCGANIRWSKRHKPIWFVRVIRKVLPPWRF